MKGGRGGRKEGGRKREREREREEGGSERGDEEEREREREKGRGEGEGGRDGGGGDRKRRWVRKRERGREGERKRGRKTGTEMFIVLKVLFLLFIHCFCVSFFSRWSHGNFTEGNTAQVWKGSKRPDTWVTFSNMHIHRKHTHHHHTDQNDIFNILLISPENVADASKTIYSLEVKLTSHHITTHVLN